MEFQKEKVTRPGLWARLAALVLSCVLALSLGGCSDLAGAVGDLAGQNTPGAPLTATAVSGEF